MKRIDDIEKSGFQELERIAADESVEVPAELEARIRRRHAHSCRQLSQEPQPRSQSCSP